MDKISAFADSTAKREKIPNRQLGRRSRGFSLRLLATLVRICSATGAAHQPQCAGHPVPKQRDFRMRHDRNVSKWLKDL